MASIVLAAHDEAAVIGPTLDALRADAGDTAEIIVVANGCTDDTADVARRHGATVVEVPEAGKAAALNAGDAVATSFPRLYLDADIAVPPGTVQALVDALASGALAAVPARRLVLDGRPTLVRAYHLIQARLPVFRDGLFGRGLIALSEEGRSRFDTFPLMVADDLFLDSLFAPHERVLVAAVEVPVETPRSTGALLRRLVRVRRGNAAMRAAAASGLVGGQVRPAARWSWLTDVVRAEPRLAPAGLAYAGLSLAAAVGARRGSRGDLHWGRDASTRGGAEVRPGRLRVGLMGVQCDSANLGLAALAYGAVALADAAAPGETDITLFSDNSDAALARMAADLGLAAERLTAVPFRRKQPAAWLRTLREMRRCSMIWDFTGGDSFSDLYGTRRIARKLLDKELALRSGTPLVLAPQTYGPFRHRATLPWVRHVLQGAALVVTRDELSRDFLAQVTPRDVVVATDVAMALPWDARPDADTLPDASPRRVGDASPGARRPRIGLNVSGLLWNGGYTGRNQFGLVADYRAYCRGLVEALLADGAQVHLVSHVLSRGDADDEDDVAAARALLADLQLGPGIDPAPEPGEGPSRCVLAPAFASPVEAKSHIATLDAFVGSRMHATIAAFSSGVPCVPVAYSRKFAGLFGSLGYPVLVDLTRLDTGPAVTETLAYLHRLPELTAQVRAGAREATERLGAFTDAVASLSRR